MALFQLSCWWDAQHCAAGRTCRASGRGVMAKPCCIRSLLPPVPIRTGPALGALLGCPSPTGDMSEPESLVLCFSVLVFLPGKGPGAGCTVQDRGCSVSPMASSSVRGLVTCSPRTRAASHLALWALQSDFDYSVTTKTWVQSNLHLASKILISPLSLLPWGKRGGKWLQVVCRSLSAKG